MSLEERRYIENYKSICKLDNNLVFTLKRHKYIYCSLKPYYVNCWRCFVFILLFPPFFFSTCFAIVRRSLDSSYLKKNDVNISAVPYWRLTLIVSLYNSHAIDNSIKPVLSLTDIHKFEFTYDDLKRLPVVSFCLFVFCFFLFFLTFEVVLLIVTLAISAQPG